MSKHSIEISLTDREEKFVRWLMKYDKETNKLNGIDRNVTFRSECTSMFYTELRSLMELYAEEMEADDNE